MLVEPHEDLITFRQVILEKSKCVQGFNTRVNWLVYDLFVKGTMKRVIGLGLINRCWIEMKSDHQTLMEFFGEE